MRNLKTRLSNIRKLWSENGNGITPLYLYHDLMCLVGGLSDSEFLARGRRNVTNGCGLPFKEALKALAEMCWLGEHQFKNPEYAKRTRERAEELIEEGIKSFDVYGIVQKEELEAHKIEIQEIAEVLMKYREEADF